MNPLHTIRSPRLTGPLFISQKGRSQYDHPLNETSSLTDPVFEATVPRREGLLSSPELVKRYTEAMEHHLEKRVAIFFQQLVACYKTKLHFEIGQTLDQGKSAPALQAFQGGKWVKQSVRNAAHSSTIPCLIAYDKEKWDAYQEDDEGEKPEGFVYLKGTDLYRSSNATIDMPRKINEADIAIDGTSKNALLRDNSIELLNQASQGKITPTKGLKTFLKTVMKQVKSAREKSGDQAIQTALKQYRATLKKISSAVDEDPELFSRMLDVQIDPDTDTAELRKTIYQIRYHAIRENLLGQAQLIEKIEKVKKQIFAQLSRGFHHREGAFRYALSDLATGENKVRLRKLYNLPPEEENSRYARTKNEILKQKTTLRPLVKELERDMDRMRVQEIRQRASITKTLRAIKEWRQVDLSRRIQEEFPHLPSSQPTLSRIETGKRNVDPEYAEKLSRVFKVDAGLFIPHFFYE